MSDRSGQSLGTYRLVRLLGQGGFAEVYLGQHIHLNTQAAVKILLATRLDDEAEIEGFRREAQTIANLSHAHIVRVLDFNIVQGVPFFVMEYAAQGSLRNIYPRGTQLSLPTVISYIRQVAAALQYAHEHKQIHRDVKPENILVRDDGSLMLSDFGIATIAHSSASQRTEDMIGTVMYMAPEQTQGRPHPASDQYALAITAYEWLAGKHPFRGTTIEIAIQHATATPPPLAAQVPGLPAAVERVLFKAMAKEPKERFATIQEFAQALEQAERGISNPLSLASAQTERDKSNPGAHVKQAQPLAGLAYHTPVNTPSEPLRTPVSGYGPQSGGISVNDSLYGQLRAYAPPPPPYQQPGAYIPQQPGYVQPSGYPYTGGYQYQQPSQAYSWPRSLLYNTTHPNGPTSLKMSPNAAAGLSYLGSWVTGLIFVLGEKQSRFVRFHALQSIFYTCAYVVWVIVIGIVEAAMTTTDAYGATTYNPAYSAVSGIASLVGLLSFVLWLVCMLCAFRGNYFKLPLIGNWALKIANRPKQR
jgi:serine/threonine protein kinase